MHYNNATDQTLPFFLFRHYFYEVGNVTMTQNNQYFQLPTYQLMFQSPKLILHLRVHEATKQASSKVDDALHVDVVKCSPHDLMEISEPVS